MPKRIKFFFLLISNLIFCSCGTSPQNLSLNGFAFAILSPNISLVDFGTNVINTPKIVTVSIQNVGNHKASSMQGSFAIDAFKFTGDNYPGLNGTCQNFLSPGEACILEIKFEASYESSFQDFIRLDFFDGSQLSYTISPIVKGKTVITF